MTETNVKMHSKPQTELKKLIKWQCFLKALCSLFLRDVLIADA